MRLRALLGSSGPITLAVPDIARGFRAALLVLPAFYLAATYAHPELTWTALGGWLGTLADPGGSRATRAKALVAFAIAGAAAVGLTEACEGSRVLSTLVLAGIAFAAGLVRAAGPTASLVGLMVAIGAAIASGRPSPVPLRDALYFGLGATLAVLVSSVVWPIWTHLPVRRSLARVYEELAAYAAAAGGAAMLAIPRDDPQWGALLRQHHRRIRDALEAARDMALAMRARREGDTRLGRNTSLLLGAAEAQFPRLGTLVQEVESLPSEARTELATCLGETTAAYAEINRILGARALQASPKARPTPRAPAAGAAASRAGALAAHLASEARAALELTKHLDEPFGAPALEYMPLPPRTDERAPLGELHAGLRAIRDALCPQSVLLHHALRSACAAAVASIAGGFVLPGHSNWVTLTTLVILQPHIGATIQRALERVVGTVLGCALAAALTLTVRSPIVLTTIMVPLLVAAVATQPQSRGLFTVFLTPVFVLLAERHLGDWQTAAERVAAVAVGGVIAVVAGTIFLPSSERQRLPDALASMLGAVSSYAHVVLTSASNRGAPDADERVAAARRSAGVALGEAEVSLERLLAEPLGDKKAAADAMLLVTYTRRLGSALTAADTLVKEAPPQADELTRVEAYVAAVLRAAEAHVRGKRPERVTAAPEIVDHDPLERVVRSAGFVASLVRQD
ncbi:FUSC family protein [Polyangium sp. y55x31]|uniref:FUSC family protein n=1 Tax=Polyangium sp. y55x31 TaxID=3042688 RepID=UPI0024831FC7|nr:FUSC family protein [Polyangium sp. y55x31]MDI1481055.1 FUSC family protein [Polyangium sp. y55x31]